MTNTKTNKTYKGELISDLDTRYHSEKKIPFYGVGFGNHFKQEEKNLFKNSLQESAIRRESDLPPMVYHNICNFDNMTTAIVSPKSYTGKVFWDAI